MITKVVIQEAPKTTDELWAAIQKGFWAIDDDSLDNLFHQKTVACVQIAQKEGEHVQNDEHTGYRTAKNKLGRPPTWDEMQGLCKTGTEWIYKYEVQKKKGGRKKKSS